MEYKAATAFEALIGYLYLTGDRERMEKMIRTALEPEQEE
jgi:23S rRNA maturation mini-RNase III